MLIYGGSRVPNLCALMLCMLFLLLKLLAKHAFIHSTLSSICTTFLHYVCSYITYSSLHLDNWALVITDYTHSHTINFKTGYN